MIDASFIRERVQRGVGAAKKVESDLAGLSLEQLNWKTSPKSWSVAECLEHLIVADTAYFPQLEKIARGEPHMTTWAKWSPFSRFNGWIMKNNLQESVKIKLKAPSVFNPTSSQLDRSVVERFLKHLDTFLDFMTRCARSDLDKTIITSPSVAVVTYNLRDAFHFLMEHEHRHINQAMRVKLNPSFPK